MFFDKSIQLVNKLKNYTIFFYYFCIICWCCFCLVRVESKRDNGKNGSKIEMLCVFILVLFSLCLFSSVCFSYKINELIFELELKFIRKWNNIRHCFFKSEILKLLKLQGIEHINILFRNEAITMFLLSTWMDLNFWN